MNKRRLQTIISIFFVSISIFFTPIYVDAKNTGDYINHATIKSMTQTSGNATEDESSECEETVFGCVEDEDSVAWLLQKLLNYIKILGPTIAIVMGSLDFAKAIISSDEDNMKKSQRKFIQRIIAAVLLFFIPLLVEVLLGMFGITGTKATGGLK